jgi:hypothetical protein
VNGCWNYFTPCISSHHISLLKENPTREEYDQWLLLAKNSLVASGFSALIRGDVLRENVKLVDHTLLPVPTEVAAAAAVASENAKITARNLANQAERESNEREYKVRLDRPSS